MASASESGAVVTDQATGEGLRVFFLPWFGASHLVPLVDIACLFAARGVRSTVLLTPASAAIVSLTVEVSAASGIPLDILICRPAETPAHLADETAWPAIESLLRLHRPDAIVADCHYTLVDEVSRDLDIPTVVFHVLGLFAVTVMQGIVDGHGYFPDAAVDELLLTGLPHPIRLLRHELPDFMLRRVEGLTEEALVRMRRLQANSIGVVANSFAAAEREYADRYRAKSWLVGPVAVAAGRRGAHQPCIDWLGSQAPGSVVYVCFGSWCRLPAGQAAELASGLEACGHPFLWVVRDGDDEGYPPEGGRGLVVRGWAPQVDVLSHVSVGGFVTHCGWNSTLEALTAGVPVVTWPLSAEQILNEKLLVEVLRVGVKNWDGVRTTAAGEAVTVEREHVSRAVGRIMGRSEEAEGMRRRATEYGEKAKEAVKEGGSSYDDLTRLIQEIKAWPRNKLKNEDVTAADD